MADFHFDQPVPSGAAVILRQLGHTVVTAWDLGMRYADDSEHLLHAAQHGRVLVTRDRDLESLRVAWKLWSQAWGLQPLPEHAGILIVSSHWRAAEVANALHQFISQGRPLANRLYRYDGTRWVG